ncbi:MAG: YlxR family protein [Actinomycetota bacterium]
MRSRCPTRRRPRRGLPRRAEVARRGRVPERICVVCRVRGPKAALLRVARLPDGTLRVDRTGAAPGRGAYLHREAACSGAPISTEALRRALRAGPSDDADARLRRDIDEVVRLA